MVPKSWVNSSIYPKGSYFHKIINPISLETDKFEFLKIILSGNKITRGYGRLTL